MLRKEKKSLDKKGFACECGSFNEFPPWVYAHWVTFITHTCGCGRQYEICEGVATLVEKPAPRARSRERA
jgi:hypothetical protein